VRTEREIVACFDARAPQGVEWREHCLRAVVVMGGILDDIGRPCRLVTSTALAGLLAMIEQIHYTTPRGDMPRMIGYLLGMEVWIDFAVQADEIQFVSELGEMPLGRFRVLNLVDRQRSVLELLARAAI
jgi:hypothetical protein